MTLATLSFSAGPNTSIPVQLNNTHTHTHSHTQYKGLQKTQLEHAIRVSYRGGVCLWVYPRRYTYTSKVPPGRLNRSRLMHNAVGGILSGYLYLGTYPYHV